MYPPFPPAFQVGMLSIHWYGIFIVTAIFVGALLASSYLTWRGQDGRTIWGLLLWIALPALLGARLYAVLTRSPDNSAGPAYYLAHPLDILAFWQGGLHLYGALIGGGIALALYTSARKLPTLIHLDAIAFALPLSQAVGRLASFINQEWYGPPTTLPWGVRIDPAYRVMPYHDLVRYPENVLFQPLFLYEILWNLAGSALIFSLASQRGKKLRSGGILLIYLVWYPLGRFCLEFFRPDAIPFPHIPFDLVQLLSAFVALASLVLLLAHPRSRTIQQPAATWHIAHASDQFEEEESTSEEGMSLVVEYSFWHRYQSLLKTQDDDLAEDESEGLEDMEESLGWHPANHLTEMPLEDIGENIEEEDTNTKEDEEEEEEEAAVEESMEEEEEETEEESEEEEGTEEVEEESEEEESTEGGSEEEEESTEEAEAEAEEEAEEATVEGAEENSEGDNSGDDNAEWGSDDGSEGSDDGDAGDASGE